MKTLSGPSRILVIDDDVEVLKVLQLGLQHAGYEAEIASSTAVAQNLLRERSFHLVICDLYMPCENGLDFRERMLLTHNDLPPFLFCSGTPLSPLNPPYPQGIVGFLLKPFSVKEFLNLVKFHTDDKRKILALNSEKLAQ